MEPRDKRALCTGDHIWFFDLPVNKGQSCIESQLDELIFPVVTGVAAPTHPVRMKEKQWKIIISHIQPMSLARTNILLLFWSLIQLWSNSVCIWLRIDFSRIFTFTSSQSTPETRPPNVLVFIVKPSQHFIDCDCTLIGGDLYCLLPSLVSRLGKSKWYLEELKHIGHCCISSGLVVWNQTEVECLNSILTDNTDWKTGWGEGGAARNQSYWHCCIVVLSQPMLLLLMLDQSKAGTVKWDQAARRHHHHQFEITISLLTWLGALADILSSTISPSNKSTMVQPTSISSAQI